MSMFFIDGKNVDPCYNLAFEEYFFRSPPVPGDFFLLWQNDNAVIVGKNQNSLEEVNLSYTNENNIKVVRRITGGGAVYHDLGNINFSFIQNKDDFSKVDMKAFIKPIIKALHEIGVEAEFNSRNDITIDGRKFSGNAQLVKDNRILHHGTLLFRSNLEIMTKSLNVSANKLAAKNLQSVHSRVTNIGDHVGCDVTLEDFKNSLISSMSKQFQLKPYLLTEQDEEAIRLLREKYTTWDWNFGKSPVYNTKKEVRLSESGMITLYLLLEQDTINNIKIHGDFFGTEDIADLEKMLTGQKLNEDSIKQILNDISLEQYVHGMTVDQFIKLLIS